MKQLLVILAIIMNSYQIFAQEIQLNKTHILYENKAYTIQIFSSKNKELATSFAKEINKKHKVFIWTKEINGVIWYRVCVGIFNLKRIAAEQLLLLQYDNGLKDAFVINWAHDKEIEVNEKNEE